MSVSPEIHQTIDTCGTRCPIPLLRAKQALKSMEGGQRLKVLATDPSAKPDFDAMLKHLPHVLVEHFTEHDSNGHVLVDTFIIEKRDNC